MTTPPRMVPTPRSRARRRRATLPTFTLYGEATGPSSPLLHIESIDSRSRRHHWEIDAHVHPGLHQLLWIGSGRADAMLDENRAACVAPTAVAIPPGVAHAFRFAPGSDGYVLTVDAARLIEGDVADAAEALRQLFAEPRTFALDAGAPDVARLQTLFEALHAERQAPDDAPDDTPVPVWLARAIVWRLARLAQRDRPPRRRDARARSSAYTRWVVLLESHFREHWPVSRYAEALGLSPERLNRVVRAETGDNAKRLIQARLLREATRHLVHVAAPVSRLAFELGFDDPAYFCRFFKRATGVTPSDYRARAAGG
jgi:AraC family transcriptional activator of pobA